VLQDGTLDAYLLVALQHAFNHLAGGAHAAGVPYDKIWQMAVRARLDPGAAAVQQLVAALQARAAAEPQGKLLAVLGREAFLAVLLHFRCGQPA
jgi:hypothetical protein